MRIRLTSTFTVVLVAGLLVGDLSAGASVPSLAAVGSYDTGLGEFGAEIVSVRPSGGLAALTNVAGSIDILDVSRPESMALVRRIVVSEFGTPNSVAIHPSKDIVLVAHGTAGLQGTLSAWRVSDGALLTTATVGLQPDSVKISHNGRWAVVANEAESVSTTDNGGDGSISVVDLAGLTANGAARMSVRQVALPSAAGVPGFSTGRTDDLGRFPITNEPSTLEPESIAFDRNVAYVTLQENNGVVRVDLHTLDVKYYGLGSTSHLADLSTSGGYVPVDTLTSFREPDGIAVIGGGRYVVTADEGDSRNSGGSSGPRGGRTVTVLDLVTGETFDTGSALDDIANSVGRYPDSRSNRGGSEPEVLAATTFQGRELVAVGLERANAVVLIDVSNPRSPTLIAIAATGTGPEGVEFMHHGNRLYILAANEVSGTVTAIRVTL